MKNNGGPQSSVLSFGKLVRKGQTDSENEPEDTGNGYPEARARAREAIMLDVIFADGRIESFDYSLPKRITFLPEGRLILRFGADSVIVTGANLARVREQIAEGRRRFIRVGTEAEQDVKPEDAAHIERIDIETGEEGL